MDAGSIAHRIERLITDVGDIGEPVKRALRAVPRHLFIPPVALAGLSRVTLVIDREADADGWWDAVYSRMAIVTQLDDGITPLLSVIGEDGSVNLAAMIDYTCSNSSPSTVADLLGLLGAAPGHRVLDVGTGTGWTAGLLSHLVGDQRVISIEVDPMSAEQAAKNLAVAGVQPYLLVGDGADGCPEWAPYDRVHVTCGIRSVPYAWVEQTRPGGVIVLPYCPGFGADHALRLTVGPDGDAHGRFPGSASYMLMRSQRVPRDRPLPGADEVHEFTTRIDPRTIANAPAGADLAISALTGLGSHGHRYDDTCYRLWVTDPAHAGQWASVTWRADAREFEVYQVGDRPVWEEAVDAYFRWAGRGEPERGRFGMTVTPDGQHLWLDDPTQVIGGRQV
jgi:protein-L-isoaspartate(D-aspartate) O-methyltransferase